VRIPVRRDDTDAALASDGVAGSMNNELTQQKTERNTTMRRPAMKFRISAIALGCVTLLSGCGCGGDGGGSSSAGLSRPLTSCSRSRAKR
jgi:hypothetical protein